MRAGCTGHVGAIAPAIGALDHRNRFGTVVVTLEKQLGSVFCANLFLGCSICAFFAGINRRVVQVFALALVENAEFCRL